MRAGAFTSTLRRTLCLLAAVDPHAVQPCLRQRFHAVCEPPEIFPSDRCAFLKSGKCLVVVMCSGTSSMCSLRRTRGSCSPAVVGFSKLLNGGCHGGKPAVLCVDQCQCFQSTVWQA
ncbi:uncharacterized protein B0H18DRAFT_994827 [Fomitopsis serialis]|uniref:uncharacterized protein n=1 Tax=Fomitopsis serialis TaxID=139415 RepID=UPI00200827A0|nr:uncharacterized protein B0H18DRAFT_994827 [Neoantrodia serialis]KAH9930019.1 hypothetical protein B0H18DRAFT_994827 [Neoantrodia serialis]